MNLRKGRVVELKEGKGRSELKEGKGSRTKGREG